MPRTQRQTILALAVLFLVVLGWVELVGPFPGDRAGRDWYETHHLGTNLRDLAVFAQTLAEPLVALLTVAALAAAAAHRRGRRAAAFILASSAVVVVVALLKLLIGPTPPWVDLVTSHARNFPSGHVAYATAVFGSVAWLATGRRNRDVRVVALALVVLMGPARLAQGSHLVSDVIAGYALGAAWLIAMAALCRPPR